MIHGISNRAVCPLASAVLEDFVFILTEIKLNVIDKNKVRKARKRNRIILQTSNTYMKFVTLFRKDFVQYNYQDGIQERFLIQDG